MGYDLVDEIKLQEYRMNNMKDCNIFDSHEKPDTRKWNNGDCQKCKTPFSVIQLYKRGKKNGHLCINCGCMG